MAEYIEREAAIKIVNTPNYNKHDMLFALKTIPAASAADAIEELSKPKWISVEERLPEDGSLVGKLIADSDGNIRIASQCAEITLSGGKTVYTDLIDLVSLLAEDTPTIEWEDCTHITHWMPLPSTEGLNET